MNSQVIGFGENDPVAILDSSGPILDRLHRSDGSWLVPVMPRIFPVGDPGLESIVAVIDTGVCDEHPSLAGRIIEQVDLTGEGVSDQNGHGTAVAAILAVTSQGTNIISVKGLCASGEATIAELSHAMRTAARLLEGRGRIINLSAGRRTPSCQNNCPLCATAIELDHQGFLLVCAAGNEPGVTYCPAKSAIAVATPDEWSAPGDVVDIPPGWEVAR